MTGSPRWFSETEANHSAAFVDRFRSLAAAGVDLGGEARLVDAMVAPRARVLDAGCGTGRVGAVLAERGHVVVGVDIDPTLIAAAELDHPGPTWLVADLADLDLAARGVVGPFDAAVLAGNVMTYVAEHTEAAVLTRLREHLRPDAPVLVGFGTDRGYRLGDFDTDCATAGLALEHRFATWDLRPWNEHSTFAVSVLRTPRVAS